MFEIEVKNIIESILCNIMLTHMCLNCKRMKNVGEEV